jgi:photosystem II stability/assembly factor-like uncharacterized protein
VCALAGSGLFAQGQAAPQPAPPVPPPINATTDPLLKPFIWRSIGPANMGGRIDDIAVVEGNPSIIYLGYATGGIWKTTNNGTTWTPIFDTYPVSSIGDIAIAPSNPDVIYVGTGEPNNRQSSSFGAGVYKSIDAGKTFEYVGLEETQSIGRIVVHPKDPNIAYVAAVGHLFGPNKERGLYKTTDGGKTWTNTKFIDEDTGFTDVVMDPSKPDVLFAASYQRRRQPWGFNGGGPGSALWKTTDGGRTWAKLTGNGLPDHAIVGRIGLDIARSKPGTIYASIEVGPSGGTGAGVNEDGSLVAPGQGRGFGGFGGRGTQPEKPPPPDPKKSGIWRSDDSGKTWRVVSNQGDRWMYYSQVRVDPTNPEIAYQGGAPFFKTVDGGKTWRQVGGIPHSDHHAIWINPKNAQHILLGNDGGLAVSYDQAETWEYVNTMPTGQFYAISADMRKPYYVCGGLQDNGSWCGPSATRSTNGITNFDWFRIGGGDGFYTANDPTDWTILYFESQDGNTSRLDLRGGGRGQSIRPRGPQTGRGAGLPAGGEQAAAMLGMSLEQARALAAQFGMGGNPSGNVVPAPDPKTNFRFFWNTPFILSPHNPRTVYLGGDRLFRSYNRGDTWTASPDLTRNVGRNDRPIMGVDGTAPMASKHDGAASYSNITTIAESYVLPGVLWVGTNDGNVQVSRDGGATWTNVIERIPGTPKEAHVSRVETSYVDAGTAYVSIDAHRTDDHQPYVYRTTDYGQTWTSIAANLPKGNVNVVKTDPKNPNLLYLGTEYGFYISLNGGQEWKRFMQGLPTVRIDDVMVHPRDNDLILGTHGRSIYIMDDITPLQQLTETALKADAHVFDVRPAVAYANDVQKAILVEGAKQFKAQNPARGTAISYLLKNPVEGEVKIAISDVTGREIRSFEGPKEAGLHRVQWNLALAFGGRGRGQQAAGGGQKPPAQPSPQAQQIVQFLGRGGFAGPAVPPGSYLVKVTIGDKVVAQKTLVIEADTTFMQ